MNKIELSHRSELELGLAGDSSTKKRNPAASSASKIRAINASLSASVDEIYVENDQQLNMICSPTDGGSTALPKQNKSVHKTVAPFSIVTRSRARAAAMKSGMYE